MGVGAMGPQVLKGWKFSNLVVRHPGTDYATSIRGFAALAVLAVHGGAAYPVFELSKRLGFGTEIVSNLSDFGSAGPAAFFITSGFVLSLVWERQKRFGLRKWIIRRYLRLTPLYVIVLLWCIASGLTMSFSDLIYRMLYLDAFSQALFLRDPIGVFWTVSVEFWLSLLIPFFVYLFRSVKRPEFVLLVAFVCSYLGPVVLIKLGLGDLMAWKSILSAVFCFVIGSYLSTLKKSDESAQVFKVFIMFAFGFFLMYLWGGALGAWWVAILLTSAYLGYKQTQVNDLRPQSPVIIWLGTICYGVYLLHMPILSSMPGWATNWAFFLSLPLVLLLASASWLLVERPVSRLIKPIHPIR
jgi:peptidoglycan/LPS O-acetylase OafA/YrhL